MPNLYYEKCEECGITNGHLYNCSKCPSNQVTTPVATRDPIQFRFDILDPEFLEALAKIADYGAKKYGEFNWHKSRLTGDKSPLNHIAKHFVFYHKGQQYDHPELGLEKKWHLAAIAFNAMMEFWYESHEIK